MALAVKLISALTFTLHDKLDLDLDPYHNIFLDPRRGYLRGDDRNS